MTIYLFLRFVTEVLALSILLTPNLVHAVLFLIIMFFNASVMLFCFGCSYLAIVIPMVYIGAILILFLFVVMMLDINSTLRHELQISYIPFVIGIILIFSFEMIEIFYFSEINFSIYMEFKEPIVVLANFIYGFDSYLFLIAGLMLFLAMAGVVSTVGRSSSRVFFRANLNKNIFAMWKHYIYNFIIFFIIVIRKMFKGNKLNLVKILLILIIVGYLNYKLWQVSDDTIKQVTMLVTVLIIIIFIMAYFIFFICKFLLCSFFSC
jgi:NADH-quinone oxidoreductase subunit J